MLNLIKVLLHYRWAERMSQTDLSQRIGVSKATMSRVESGKGMDGETMAKILRWLLESEEGEEPIVVEPIDTQIELGLGANGEMIYASEQEQQEERKRPEAKAEHPEAWVSPIAGYETGYGSNYIRYGLSDGFLGS